MTNQLLVGRRPTTPVYRRRRAPSRPTTRRPVVLLIQRWVRRGPGRASGAIALDRAPL